MMVKLLAIWSIAVMLVCHSLAIAVAPGSDCVPRCANLPAGNFLNVSGSASASSTLPADVSCFDSDYISTAERKAFRDCVTCESTSVRVDGNSSESDLNWFLFNLKYTVKSCIFRFSNSKKISSTCAKECGGIQAPLSMKSFQRNASIYQYCLDGSSFLTNADPCSECLSNQKNKIILANFVRALSAACEQKPNPGQLLRLSFEIFPRNSSSTAVASITGSTRPTQDISMPETSTLASQVSFAPLSTRSSPLSSSPTTPSSTLPPEQATTTAAADPKRKGVVTSIGVGIGIGIVGLGLVGIALFWWRERTRRNAKLQAECRQQVMEASDDYLDHVFERRSYRVAQVPATQKRGRVSHVVQLSTEYNANFQPPRGRWLI